MSNIAKAVMGALIPFLGTVLGSSMVFFLKGGMKTWLQKALLGFASGVMIAASEWSLIIPGKRLYNIIRRSGTRVFG